MAMHTQSAPRSRRRFWIGAAVLAVVLALAGLRILTIEPRPGKPYLEGGPLVLAHQGASGHAPSNTLESFRLAREMGADILELDVHMTWDGVLVVHHDATIDRQTNGLGYINTMTRAELRRYDFGYWFTTDGGQTYPYRGRGITIATLEGVFQAFGDMRINIEIKQTDPPIEEKLLRLIQQYEMEDRVLVNSFDGDVMARWRALDPEGRIATGASKSDMAKFIGLWLPRLDIFYNPSVDAFQLPVAQELGPVTIRFDTKRLIDTAHRLGIEVHYWTINDEPTMRRLLSLGADGIITDYPDRAVKVMKEMGLR